MQVSHQGRGRGLAGRSAIFGAVAVDLALDVEQGVDTLHGLQADRRQHRRALALRGPPRAARDVGQDKELPARMGQAGRFQDRPEFTTWFVKLAVTSVGVGLQDTAIASEMALRMFAAPVIT